MAQQCPKKHDTYYTQGLVLYQSDFDQPDKLENLVSEDLEYISFRQWCHKHSSWQNLVQLLH